MEPSACWVMEHFQLKIVEKIAMYLSGIQRMDYGRLTRSAILIMTIAVCLTMKSWTKRYVFQVFCTVQPVYRVTRCRVYLKQF